jgi:DNA-binding MarR family transcriptional regulator
MAEEQQTYYDIQEEERLLQNPKITPVNFEEMPIDQWRRLTIAHRTCSEMLLKSTGLTDVSQPSLLQILASCPDNTSDSQKILAERLHVTPATITVSLRSMQKNGYVEKSTDEGDQRRKRIMLTEKGKEASRLLVGFSDLLDGEMYRGFTAEERAVCADFFRRMTANLETSAENIRTIIKKRERLAAAKAEMAAQEGQK